MESKPLVLLDEDDEMDQMVIKRAVARCAIDIDLCILSDGKAALEYLGDHCHRIPSLVITDWNMPRINGEELLKILVELGMEMVPVAVLLGTTHHPRVPDGIHYRFVEKSLDIEQTTTDVCTLLEDVLSKSR